MTLAQLFLASLPGLLAGVAVFWLQATSKSNSSLGGRVGELERRADFEAGRRAGRAETLAERREHDGK